MKPFLTFHFHFLLFLSFLLSPFQRSSSSTLLLYCVAVRLFPPSSFHLASPRPTRHHHRYRCTALLLLFLLHTLFIFCCCGCISPVDWQSAHLLVARRTTRIIHGRVCASVCLSPCRMVADGAQTVRLSVTTAVTVTVASQG